jgi:adenylate cyclase
MGESDGPFNPTLSKVLERLLPNEVNQITLGTLMSDQSLACPAVDRALRWFLGSGRTIASTREMLQGLVGELVQGGFPILRLFLGVKTLHPQIGGVSFIWSKDKPEVEFVARERRIFQSAMYFDSPVERVYSGAQSYIRRRLVGDDVVMDFPILHEIKEQGATDYAIFGLEFSGKPSAVISLTTDAPDGFSDAQLESFKALLPLLSLAMEAREWQRRSKTLLETYLGEDAGRRVLGGLIERGEGITIAAAIWFCDLRDFTPLSNSLPKDEMIALLNDYFDTMTRPVTALKGEILKFIGDAILAIFPMKDDLDRDEKCRVALEAAKKALEGLSDLNELRASSGKPPLKVGIGLHAGSVTYGNIGTAHRLDFTVIGPAVNLASRISGLCRDLNQPLLSSRAFASPCGTRLEPMGTFELRGFDQPQQVFGLPED